MGDGRIIFILSGTEAEAGFLNTEADNELFDNEFNQVAQAIASGALKTLGENQNSGQELPEVEQNQTGMKYYRVQTGAFRNKEYARELLDQLLAQSFPAFILYDDHYYKVQVGAFRQLDNAVKMEETLRRYGYSTFITT